MKKKGKPTNNRSSRLQVLAEPLIFYPFLREFCLHFFGQLSSMQQKSGVYWFAEVVVIVVLMLFNLLDCGNLRFEVGIWSVEVVMGIGSRVELNLLRGCFKSEQFYFLFFILLLVWTQIAIVLRFSWGFRGVIRRVYVGIWKGLVSNSGFELWNLDTIWMIDLPVLYDCS